MLKIMALNDINDRRLILMPMSTTGILLVLLKTQHHLTFLVVFLNFMTQVEFNKDQRVVRDGHVLSLINDFNLFSILTINSTTPLPCGSTNF